ncbi:MAG: hypothetical protein HN878_02075, partial [Candidatus Diapherotrites archaeon]|nr:hypothetical protein [Candidatus Diapherotrites archaeon]
FAMQEFNQNKTIKNKTDPDLTPITVNEFTYLNEQGDYLIKNNSAEKNILILGSCRVIHHLNAFLRIKEFGDNYNYVVIRTQKGLNEKIQENIFSDPCLVGLIKNSDIFIHEYVINFEYLNTDPDCEKNIYKVKKDFEKDITLPNLPLLLMTLDLMLLYHEEFREKYKKYIRNMDKYYNDLVKDASLIRDGSVEKYCEICDKCDLSSLGNWFRDNYQKKRMFYNSNHPSNELQYKVLQSVLEKHWPTKKFDLSRVEKLFTHRELLINPRRSYSDFDVKELGYVYAQNEAMPLEKLNRAVHGIPTYFLEKINDLDLDDIIAVFTDDKPRDALISADGEKASHLQIINNNKIIEVIENPKEINEIINLLKEKKVGSVAFADVSKETVQAFGRAGMKSYSIGGSVNEYL